MLVIGIFGEFRQVMLYSVNIYRALACLIILNFHMERLYPDSLSFFSFGSDLGNNMFFLVSGFTLIPSIEKAEFNFSSFMKWTAKRWTRIVPMVLFMEILTVLVSGTKLSWDYFFKEFIFPTEFWFTGAIIIFYPLLFIIEKIDNKILKITVVSILLVLHLVRDDIFAERYFIGFIALIIGTEIRKNVSIKLVDDKLKPAFFTGLSAFLTVILKVVRSKMYERNSILHLLVEISVVFTAAFLLLLLYQNEKKVGAFCEKYIFWDKTFVFLSSITLSAYLIQLFDDCVIIRYLKFFPFPISIIICVFVVCGSAAVLTNVDISVRRTLKMFLKSE